MTFVLLFIGIWVVLAGGWMMFSNASKSADADKIKSRLLGATRQGKPKKGGTQRLSLLNIEDSSTGKVVLSLLARFQLTDRLRLLIDQAGLKWRRSATDAHVPGAVSGGLRGGLAVFCRRPTIRWP